MAKVLRGLVSTAATGWLLALGLTGERLAPGDSPEWVSPILGLVLAVGATATLAAVILYALPPVVEAYRMGIEVGEHRARTMDAPRPRLRPVR